MLLYSCHSHSFSLWRQIIMLMVPSNELEGMVGCWVGLMISVNGVSWAMVASVSVIMSL
jgi:hypothetical protein